MNFLNYRRNPFHNQVSFLIIETKGYDREILS